MSTPELLMQAQRQYRHNTDNSPDFFKPRDGFVIAFDYDKTCKIVKDLETQITDLRDGNEYLLVQELRRKVEELEVDIENLEWDKGIMATQYNGRTVHALDRWDLGEYDAPPHLLSDGDWCKWEDIKSLFSITLENKHHD